MATVDLDVRLDGFSEPIGLLRSDEQMALTFTYKRDYLGNRDAFPLFLQKRTAFSPSWVTSTEPG